MTLTYPIINRARCVLFVVTGSDKVAALAALRSGDRNIPAAHVTGQRLVVMADAARGRERSERTVAMGQAGGL
jgi:6-phosphogluconolactonase